MKRYLLEDLKHDLGNKILPITVHYAILKEFDNNDYLSNSREVDGDLPNCFKRYRTNKYLPGNKFYKSISRTLNV